MDLNSVESVLESWGMPQDVIETFKEHGLEVEQLSCLDNELLKELIPQMGVRLKAFQEIKKLKEIEDSLNHRDCSATTVTNEASFSAAGDDLPENNATEEISESTPVILSTNIDSIVGQFGILQPRYEDFDLKTLLLTSPLGKSILNYYNAYKKLDNTRRNRLVSIIVKHLYNHIVKNRLQQDEYNSLAAKIVVLFPTEPLGIYYCPPVKKALSPNRKSVMSRGKLVNHCRNILFRSGDTVTAHTRGKRKYPSEDEDNGVVPTSSNGVNLKDTYAEEIAWLRHNFEPWSKVIDYWSKTWEVRSANNVTTVSEYIENWPIINDLRAPALITLDFEKKYSQCQVAFHMNWDSFIEKIITYKNNEIKDQVALSLKASLASLQDEGIYQLYIVSRFSTVALKSVKNN